MQAGRTRSSDREAYTHTHAGGQQGRLPNSESPHREKQLQDQQDMLSQIHFPIVYSVVRTPVVRSRGLYR